MIYPSLLLFSQVFLSTTKATQNSFGTVSGPMSYCFVASVIIFDVGRGWWQCLLPFCYLNLLV